MDSLEILKNIKETLQTQVQQIEFENGEPVTPTTTYSLGTPIETLLDNGVAEFWYYEKDGSLRFAVGTRNDSIIKKYTDWTWVGPSPSPKVCAYYDTQRGDWRSFIRKNFVQTTFFTDANNFIK
jgi:hypothetical protein